MRCLVYRLFQISCHAVYLTFHIAQENELHTEDFMKLKTEINNLIKSATG